MKGKVGMVVPKSTQTGVVEIITYKVHSYACFSGYELTRVCVFVPCSDTLVLPTAHL